MLVYGVLAASAAAVEGLADGLRAAATCMLVCRALAAPAAAKQLKNLPMASERQHSSLAAAPLEARWLQSGNDLLSVLTTGQTVHGHARPILFGVKI